MNKKKLLGTIRYNFTYTPADHQHMVGKFEYRCTNGRLFDGEKRYISAFRVKYRTTINCSPHLKHYIYNKVATRDVEKYVHCLKEKLEEFRGSSLYSRQKRC
jgi:hypothetical protein